MCGSLMAISYALACPLSGDISYWYATKASSCLSPNQFTLIKAGYRIGFEPTAVGFTRVPVTFKQFARQRRRWARGMIEGFKYHWDMLLRRPRLVTYLLSLDLLFPLLDLTYTLVFIPGIFLALLGHFWVVGPMTLAVLPLTLLIQWVMYRYQRRVFSELGLKIRRNRLGTRTKGYAGRYIQMLMQ